MYNINEDLVPTPLHLATRFNKKNFFSTFSNLVTKCEKGYEKIKFDPTAK